MKLAEEPNFYKCHIPDDGVMPAKAGIQVPGRLYVTHTGILYLSQTRRGKITFYLRFLWIPAFAGMTQSTQV